MGGNGPTSAPIGSSVSRTSPVGGGDDVAGVRGARTGSTVVGHGISFGYAGDECADHVLVVMRTVASLSGRV
jgi:hypothetical protein